MRLRIALYQLLINHFFVKNRRFSFLCTNKSTTKEQKHTNWWFKIDSFLLFLILDDWTSWLVCPILLNTKLPIHARTHRRNICIYAFACYSILFGIYKSRKKEAIHMFLFMTSKITLKSFNFFLLIFDFIEKNSKQSSVYWLNNRNNNIEAMKILKAIKDINIFPN